MEIVSIEGYEFIKLDLGGANAVFSTGKNGLDFNKNTSEGRKSIENIKKWFDVNEVGFLNQTHSDDVYIYNGKVEDGDALITNKESAAVGVFTADCVPILLYDKASKVVAAIHSGWRGTFSCIVSKTIEKMKKVYGTKSENLAACIGPHIHQCCYEVSDELIEKFKNSEVYKDVDIAKGRMLSMAKCITHQLDISGVRKENIHHINLCTLCSDEFELHSYRKSINEYKRQFSFIFIRLER